MIVIEFLRGKLLQLSPSGVVVDVNGVGYGVELPLSALYQLPSIGSEVSLWIYTHVREDSLRLFGFVNNVDRSLFVVLLSVGGIGPKLALAMLSTLKFESIRQAVIRGHIATFEAVPGIGKRLAEKILVDLKPKLKKLEALYAQNHAAEIPRQGGAALLEEHHTPVGQDVFEDVRSALENFGFKERDINDVINKLGHSQVLQTFPEMMRLALTELGPGRFDHGRAKDAG